MGNVPTWTTACPDWEERIIKGESLIPFAPLFPKEADEACEYFKSLRMVDAPGSPLMEEVTLPWAMEFVSHIFGSYDSETGIRHITEYFLLISKKNAKSTNAAAIMMVALLLCWRNSGEFIVLSPTIEIAGNSFKPAADMVRHDDELSELLQVQDHVRTITHRLTGASLKVVAADNNTVSGKKAIGVLVDELWLFGKMPNAESMLREATGGLAARPEGFVIYLSTQSNEPPAGVFKQKLDYARKVRDGEVDDKHFLPVLYEFPRWMLEKKLYLDPKYFYITNPNLNASVNVQFLERELQKAKDTDEESLRDFLAKHLNVEIGMNLRSDRWPGADFWEANEFTSTKITLDFLLEHSEVVTVGIDGGGLDDLLGLAVIGRANFDMEVCIEMEYDEETGMWRKSDTPEWRTVQPWLLWNHAWAHPSVMQRRQEIAPRLRDFAKQKDLTLVRHIGQDTEELADIVGKIEESGLLFQAGMDPAAVGGILDAILSREVPEDKMVSVSQGWKLAGAIKTTERKVAERILVHGGTPLMAWSVGNAKTKVVGNAIVVTKQVSGTAKIDPLMATFNAVHLMALNPPAQQTQLNFDHIGMVG